MKYSYDAAGRLCKVVGAGGEVTQYTYDGAHRMVTAAGADGRPWFTNHYDGGGRCDLQTLANGGTFKFVYTLDPQGHIVGTDVTDPDGKNESVTFDAGGYPIEDDPSQPEPTPPPARHRKG